MRQQVRDGQKLPETISAEHIRGDALFQPVLEDDGLIVELDEVLAEVSTPEPAADQGGDQDLAARNSQLEAELASLKDQFATYRLTVEDTLNRRWGLDPDSAAEPEVAKPSRTGVDSGYWESYAGRGKSSSLEA